MDRQSTPASHGSDIPLPLDVGGELRDPRPRRRGAPPLTELVVDPVEHAADIARFTAKLAYPPPLANGRPNPMCWIWTGAITDSYGQFSVVRNGFAYTIKAHRFAAAWRLGIPISRGERADHSTGGLRQVVEHVFCDNPICVRADPDPAVGHIWPSTQRDNLARGGHRHRVGGSNWFVRRWSRLDKHERDERSRQLRAAVIDGWDQCRVRDVLLRIDPAQLDAFAPTH
jgi:hypothetical protein